MTFTDDDLIAQIIASVGDVDAANGDPTTALDGVLATGVPDLWDKYAPKDAVISGLREAFTRRDAIRLVMAILIQRRFDVADNLSGLSIRQNQVYQHYQDMYDCAKAEITALMTSSAKIGHPASQVMPATLARPPADRTQWWIDWENRRRGLA